MSILETFYILFKGDTTDLKKSSDDALKSTKKLTSELNSVELATDKIGKKFSGFAHQLIGAAAAYVSIGSVINGLKGAVDYDVALGNASRALGVNAEQLDAWDNAVRKTGGTAEGFQGSLKGLADHFHTTAKEAMKVLPQLADVFSHISRYAAFNYGKAIGLDEPTILLLQQGRREVESVLKKQKEFGLVTEQQIEISRQYNNSLGDLKQSFRSLFNEIAIPALPYIEKFFKMIETGIEYLKNHKDLVNGFLMGIGILAASALAALALVNLPITAIVVGLTLLVGLFALLWDDLSVWAKGGKSVFGELYNSTNIFVNALTHGLKDILETIFPVLRAFEYLSKMMGFIKGLWGSGGDEFKIKFGSYQDALALASGTPLNSQTSNSVLNSSAFNRNFTINSMPITVNTQATDAVGISRDIGLHFKDHYALAVNNAADNTYV